MTAIAILSDVHGNLHALEAVLEAVAGRGIARWWCLGDMVGYGAFPAETLAACVAGAERCLAGNHDLGAAGRVPMAEFSDAAAVALAWTAERLDDDAMRALARLQPQDVDSSPPLYHASPRDPVWEYVLTPRQAEHALVDSPRPLTLVGHTHMAAAWNLTGADGLRRIRVDQGAIALGRGRWLVNPGSVGQPRDHDPRASWAVFDPENETIEVIRTPYDVHGAQAAIRDAGLPRLLADRLGEGR
ncbi:MAG: metallophosphoesterase family protein [Thermoleophilia bacterium]|nr:metallophosphoesterase family protein [Thermoleophilia bacterium]